jgi:hypothetical protein
MFLLLSSVCYYSFFVHQIFHWPLGITFPCDCDLISIPAFFGTGNIATAIFPNNNINKGRWTQEEHKIFMQEYEKYGNNCMHITQVLSTQTSAQIKKYVECFFKQNLKTNSEADNRHRESLSPGEKAQVLVKHASEHQNYRQSLSPEDKTEMLSNDTAAHKKQRESLPPEKKVKILETNAAAHKKQCESLPPKKKVKILETDAAAHKKQQESVSLNDKA